MKPLIKYRGGKARELRELLPFAPKEYDRYVEPFFGGGAMFWHLESEKALLNDLNAKLIGFYAGVRDDWERFSTELRELDALYARNRKEFEERKNERPDERVEDENDTLYYSLREQFNGKHPAEWSEAVLYYAMNKMAYSGMVRHNALGEFNVPYGRYRSIGVENVTLAHSELLRRAELRCGDYVSAFDEATEYDFMFLDPPYDCVFNDYGNDSWGVEEYERLAERFGKLRCKALMVIGGTELTRRLFGGYVVASYEKVYGVNIRNRFKSSAEHLVCKNF